VCAVINGIWLGMRYESAARFCCDSQQLHAPNRRQLWWLGVNMMAGSEFVWVAGVFCCLLGHGWADSCHNEGLILSWVTWRQHSVL
jgi:hypothetical protein